jgi:hypothetical protein
MLNRRFILPIRLEIHQLTSYVGLSEVVATTWKPGQTLYGRYASL